MSALLNSLKLTAQAKPSQASQTEQRRSKLLKRLDEQMKLATAQSQNQHYVGKRLRYYTDEATGLRKQVEADKRIKAWWFEQTNGKLALCVRYGSKVLELSKGKFAVEVASTGDLVKTLEVISAAVKQGELDNAISTAANKLREGFKE
ncbi:MAG: hypothetical protein EBV69_04710 [Oxalobacteraceae bacterium]|jgi:hypothetical protein|nr:hypothetical protein [Oxalobacteraceae bacterium]